MLRIQITFRRGALDNVHLGATKPLDYPLTACNRRSLALLCPAVKPNTRLAGPVRLLDRIVGMPALGIEITLRLFLSGPQDVLFRVVMRRFVVHFRSCTACSKIPPMARSQECQRASGPHGDSFMIRTGSLQDAAFRFLLSAYSLLPLPQARAAGIDTPPPLA